MRITPARLRRRGYRKSHKTGSFWKQRLVRGREKPTPCIVQLRPLSAIDEKPLVYECVSVESGLVDTSNVESMKQVRDWERFAFCLPYVKAA
jgi:hypothetical protein